MFKKILTRLLYATPTVKKLQKEVEIYKTYYPPGHFYSPIPEVKELESARSRLFEKHRIIDGIDLNESGQIQLLESFSDLYQVTQSEKVFKRYLYDNPYYSFGDGVILFLMMLYYKPKKIIEVGSGFSSALMLDVNESHFKGEIDLRFIEPYPDRLKSLISDADSALLIEDKVQNVDLEIFRALDKNDILFIDSSHVCKTGSDLNHLLFEVIPGLNKDVLIHFHDIFYPFEYPWQWVREGRAWNENYLLRSFLSYNSSFKIEYFGDYMTVFHRDLIEKYAPKVLENSGGNLWLRKI